MVKIIVFFRRAPGMSRAEFLDYYRNKHYPLAKSVPEFWRHIRRYTQNHCIDGYGEYDACAEAWFDDINAMNAAFAEPAYLAKIRPDELKFSDVSSVVRIVATEHALEG